MITKRLLVILLFCFSYGFVQAQEKDKENSDYRNGKFYSTSEIELIFSFANVDLDSVNLDNSLRFSPVFNLTYHLNFDFTKFLGLDIGLGIRNVGFIVNHTGAENNLKKKYRTYNLGLPVGFKIGDLSQKRPFFLFAGSEIEMPIHYKEKTFVKNDKTDKITGWFSKRTELFNQSLYAGIQFPEGISIKFKYYLNNFFDSDFTYYEDGVGLKPYAGMEANVFYFSISWFPFSVKQYENKTTYSEQSNSIQTRR